MIRIFLITILVGLTAIQGTTLAQTGTWRPPIKPLEGASFAPQDQVIATVGNVSTEVVCPSTRFLASSSRGARLTLEKPGTGYRDPAVLSTLLRDAILVIWRDCNTAMGSFGNSVGFVEVYAPPTAGQFPVLTLRAQGWVDLFQEWGSVTDVGLQREQEAAAALAREQAAQAAARQRAAEEARLATERRAAAEAARRAAEVAAENQRRQQAAIAELERKLALYAPWIGVLALVLLGLAKRETLARWYYFTFHPHPAAPLVRSAIAGANLDGHALVAALSEPPVGGRVLRAVRDEQAERLFADLQVATLKKLDEQEKRRARDEYEEAAMKGIQEAVAQAAVALERAKALRRASQSVREEVQYQ